MAYPTHQQYADLAKDAYENRQVTPQTAPVGGNCRSARNVAAYSRRIYNQAV